MAAIPVPTMLASPYRLGGPNAPIRAFKGAITLTEGSVTISGPGAMAVSWLPAPRLEFDVASVGVFGMGRDPINAKIRGSIGGAPGRVTHSRFSIGSSSPSRTTGFLEGRLTRGGGANLQRLLFHLGNFPEFRGTPVRGARGVFASRVEISGGGWTIVIDGRDGLKDLIDAVARAGGYLVSHVGEIARTDGLVFRADEALQTLDALGELLSFASGARASTFLHIGFDAAGHAAWRSWEPPAVTQWASRLAWFDKTDATCLGRAFDGLVPKWADGHKREVFRRVVYLLTDANRRGIEPGLIAAQSALEILAWQILVNERKAISREGFDKLPAADVVRLLLTVSDIPLGIPVELSAMAAYAKLKSTPDGPQTLTLIRNSWVHPPRSTFTRGGPEIGDAWLLALWYIDLVALRWLGYSGNYSPRVRPGLVEAVPWA